MQKALWWINGKKRPGMAHIKKKNINKMSLGCWGLWHRPGEYFFRPSSSSPFNPSQGLSPLSPRQGSFHLFSVKIRKSLIHESKQMEGKKQSQRNSFWSSKVRKCNLTPNIFFPPGPNLSFVPREGLRWKNIAGIDISFDISFVWSFYSAWTVWASLTNF